MSSHAYLSASGSHRWMLCPGAPALEAQATDIPTAYAVEGTAAHALAAEALANWSSVTDVRREVAEYYPDGTITDEMVGYVEAYASYIDSLPGERLIEQRVSFDAWVPDGFGTADAIHFDGTDAYVTDLKYGLGVPVDAVWNSQIMIYALGVLQEYTFLYDIGRFVLTIHQPRLENVSTFEIDVDELQHWAETELAPAAKQALAAGAVRNPGVKQCQFCQARAICPELYAVANGDVDRYLGHLDRKVVDDAVVRSAIDTLDPADLAAVLDRVDLTAMWVAGVRAYGRARLSEDVDAAPGWRLEPGRARRVWADADKARTALKRALGAAVAEPKGLISPAQAEKHLGKDHSILARHVVLRPGEPRLVRSGRTEIDADAEFGDVDTFPTESE